MRLFAHQALRENRPYVRFLPGSEKFVDAVLASEPLKARARAIRDEYTDVLAKALAQAAGEGLGDPDANLAASLFVATWVVAAIEAHRVFGETGNAEQARSMFLAIIDRGTKGLRVTLEGTSYA